MLDGDTISLRTDSLGWSNADRFLANPNYQSFTVTITGPNGFDNGQVIGFASYDDYLGAWPITSRTGNVFAESHLPNIPVHFVFYGVKDGKFYGGISAGTPMNGGNFNVALSETSVAAFKALVDAL